MGYYLDLIFKSHQSLESEVIINNFINSGALRLPIESTEKPDKFVEFEWEGIPYPITVFRKEIGQQISHKTGQLHSVEAGGDQSPGGIAVILDGAGDVVLGHFHAFRRRGAGVEGHRPRDRSRRLPVVIYVQTAVPESQLHVPSCKPSPRSLAEASERIAVVHTHSPPVHEP